MNVSPDPSEPTLYLRRFALPERLLHGCLMLSFLGLSLTGLPLFFSDAPWARTMSHLFGGYGVTGTLHRFFGAIMIATFSTHVARLVKRLYIDKDLGILWGPDSLVPQPRDILQVVQHFRYFVGLGPRPRFDRFTYWEKFDYWAVFWGMGIIGTSGLMLWMPGLFAKLVPGWVFNVAFLVHGEEALLAMVFIFTIHFFNSHLRPEVFPMDTAMFTGRVQADHMAHERPAEYERLRAAGAIEPRLVPAGAPQALTIGRLIGTLAVVLGLIMVVLTLYAVLTSH
jgi:cytochrome b subunit of formate dehydrogenase